MKKIILSRIPANYSFWQRIGLFRHGYMDQASYVINVFVFLKMIAMFEEAKFVVKVSGVDRWNSLPVKRQSLSNDFISLSDDELMVSGFDVLLYK